MKFNESIELLLICTEIFIRCLVLSVYHLEVSFHSSHCQFYIFISGSLYSDDYQVFYQFCKANVTTTTQKCMKANLPKTMDRLAFQIALAKFLPDMESVRKLELNTLELNYRKAKMRSRLKVGKHLVSI